MIDEIKPVKNEIKPKEFSFELTRAEFLKPEEQEKIGGAKEGLVVVEKIAHSYPEIKLHYVGSAGITNFIKEKLEKG